MARFSGKVVIVTGSSSGIGRATAVYFAKRGAKVTITGRNAERLDASKQQILHAGVSPDDVLSVVADLATEAGQDRIINGTIARFGRLDILVNNAGAAFNDDEGRTGVSQDVKVYDRTMDINLRSVVTMTQKAKKHLIATKGEVVNVSSITAGPQAMPALIYYAMSKAALDQFTKSAAIDLIADGVRVNSVSPGLVSTGFGEALGMPQEIERKHVQFVESHKECIPGGKVGQPADIAHVIAFLADRRLSSYIIGQTIVADGGSMLVMGIQAHEMEDILKS